MKKQANQKLRKEIINCLFLDRTMVATIDDLEVLFQTKLKRIIGEKDNWADMRHNKPYLVGDIVKYRNDLRDEQLKRLAEEVKK